MICVMDGATLIKALVTIIFIKQFKGRVLLVMRHISRGGIRLDGFGLATAHRWRAFIMQRFQLVEALPLMTPKMKLANLVVAHNEKRNLVLYSCGFILFDWMW